MTDSNKDHDKSKLYLPKLCVVPLAARLDETVSDSAKIYLGELNALVNKYGYCWASDEELAEMKCVGVRTIQRWNKELEGGGHIRRDTWREHVKVKGKKGVQIRSRRKIYITDGYSKKVSEQTNMATHTEPPKVATHTEPPKVACIRKEPLKEEHNTPLPPKGVSRTRDKPPVINKPTQNTSQIRERIHITGEQHEKLKREIPKDQLEVMFDILDRKHEEIEQGLTPKRKKPYTIRVFDKTSWLSQEAKKFLKQEEWTDSKNNDNKEMKGWEI